MLTRIFLPGIRSRHFRTPSIASYLSLVLFFLPVLTSCGGGGSGTGTPPPSPDFTLFATSSPSVATAGSSVTITVNMTPVNGFTGSVSINLTGAPAGTTFSPALPVSMTPGQQNITLTIPASATPTSYNVTVQGTSGTLQHSVIVAFAIQGPVVYAGFSLTLANSEVSITQGATGSTGVGVSETSDGDTDFEVQLAVNGLPSGVTASFDTNPLAIGQPISNLTLTAAAGASLANYAVVTVVGTRSVDGLQEQSTFLLNITPPIASISPVRSDFVRTDGMTGAAVYDPVHDLVYASNPQWNRVDVISPSRHQLVNSIPAPSPAGMDLSLDGKHVIVTSNMQQIVSIDTSSQQVVQRWNVPPLAPGTPVSDIPDLVVNTSNGNALLGMTNNSSPASYSLEQWNPVSDSFAALTAPGVGSWINQLVRTGDGQKVLVVDYGSDQNLAVYDAATGSFSASGTSSVGQVLAVAGNPASHQFAVFGTNGLAFVNSNLNTLGNISLGGIFWGMQYSPDGSKLYVTMTEQFSTCGTYYPVILTIDTSSHAQVGEAAAFQTASYAGSCQNPYVQAAPLAADGAGMLYSAYPGGVVFDDAANLHNLLSLPVGPPIPGIGLNDEAPLNATLATTLGSVPYDVLPNVWFGQTPGANIQFSAPNVSVTAPASATAGLVNVTAVEPDGWFALDPQSFSYGSKILFSYGTASSTLGGTTLELIGYGLIGNNGNFPAVTIDGQTASVMTKSKYVDLISGGFDSSDAFAGLDILTATVPPGTATHAGISVVSDAGTANLPGAFSYLAASDYSSYDTFTDVLYDPQRHWVYLSAGDHIDVFDADAGQYLTPIVPPSLSGSRTIGGLALTPDNSRLLAANTSDISVAIIDPDNPASGKAVQIPITTDVSGIQSIVATSNGTAFVDGISSTTSGCGGELFELNLSTLQVTHRTDLPFAGLQLGYNAFSRSSDGSEVLLSGPECQTILWNAATDSFTQIRLVSNDSATSGDGYWLSSDYVRLDSQLIQHMQAQIPGFFTNPLNSAYLRGEKMNASGSLVYSPVPGSGTMQSNGVAVTDTNTGTLASFIMLPERIQQQVLSAMDYDEAGNRLFLITDSGLTVLQLEAAPLSIGYLNPAAGPASGGAAVTIRGSGFQSGAGVTIGGAAATTTFVDSSTLTVTVPAGTVGGARVSIQNPDGTTYSLDAGFVYQ